MARGELPSLPQEMMVEILSRLPAKTVGQFRCVSKPWSVLLSDPLFIKTHLNNRRTQENLILIFPFPNNVTIHTIADVGDDNLSRTIRFQPELPEISMRVSGSCNGLVLLFNGSLYVVNPTTLRQVQIQNLPGEILDYGLGYDACSDDYKIVAIMDGHSEEELKSSTYSFAYMYSMKKGIWKRLERSSDYRNSVPYDEIGWQSGAFISGALHWWADSRGGSCLITIFDLVDETFKEIPGPDSLNGAKKFHDVLVLKGCLCVLDTDNTETGLDRVDFWIMEEYGVKESWVKLSVTFEPDWSVVKPLCFIADDKIVLEIDEFDLIVYEFKTRTLTDFMVDGVPATFDNIGTFVVSLVWPS